MPEPKPDSRMARKRAEILRAATTAFKENGYDAVSMDRIADIAGASKRTVYNHFGSKESLFEEVVDHLLAAASDEKKVPWNPERDIEDQLRDFARAKLSMLRTEHGVDLVRVVLGVFMRDRELATSAMARAAAGEDYLAIWLERANAAGALDVPDILIATELFWGMVSGTLFWPHIFQDLNDRARESQLIDELVAVFVARYAVR